MALVKTMSLSVAAAMFPAVLLAQSTFGEFVGTVKDPSGGVIAGQFSFGSSRSPRYPVDTPCEESVP